MRTIDSFDRIRVLVLGEPSVSDNKSDPLARIGTALSKSRSQSWNFTGWLLCIFYSIKCLHFIDRLIRGKRFLLVWKSMQLCQCS